MADVKTEGSALLDRMKGGASAAPGEEVVVSFGVDTEFVPHMAATIASVVAHAPDARFRFLIVHAGVTEGRRTLVESVAPSARFDWIEIADNDLPGYQRGYLNRAVLFRLGLERLAPSDCHRVIYLDSDVIVMRDLRDLWHEQLDDCPIGAVADALAFSDELVPEFAERHGLKLDQGIYVNSGVLLIDLEAVRREELFSRAIECVVEHGNNLRFGDQCAINFAFWGRIKLLSTVWNTSRDRAIPAISETLPIEKQLNGRSPAIIHFSHEYKPWSNNGYHPWFWIYWRYLAHTPFFQEVSHKHSVGRLTRLRLWLRWLRRRPTIDVIR